MTHAFTAPATSALVLSLALLAGGAAATQTGEDGMTPAGRVASVGVDDEAHIRFRQFDLDQDGQLTIAEFNAGMAKFTGVVYQRLPAQFRALDKDQSGFLEAVEYTTVPMLRKAGADAPTLADVDANGDQRIDFKEYAALATRLSAPAN